MAPLSKTKFTILLYSFLFVSFFSCDKDVDLTANQLPESRETIVLDDTFEIPANQKSILDVLSNDTYLSDNIRIVEIGNPSNGTVVLNEDNTITYIPNSVYSYHNDSEETSNTEEGEEATTEATSTNQENTDNTNEQETTSSETSEEETNTENTASNQESNDNTNEQETTSSETEEQESAPETENAEQTQDTFTYTTETQNEDGTVSTETGTVTVDVAPDSE